MLLNVTGDWAICLVGVLRSAGAISTRQFEPGGFMKLVAEISAGELIDKITILEIKLDRIVDKSKLININREYLSLIATLEGNITATASVTSLRDQLKSVNLMLWQIEDDIRSFEKHNKFDHEFIELARSVYHRNDERSMLKKQINLITNSAIVEEKSYAAD